MQDGLTEYADGTKQWFQNGQYHRVDGPACEWADGRKDWYLNGQLHRVDGPAIEYPDGRKRWYQNGKRYSFIEWFDIVKEQLAEDQINELLFNLDEL